MRTHTSDYKNTIKLIGKEIDSIITYTLNDEEIVLGNSELNSVSPHYEGTILKSVMRQLDIDSNVDIPLNTILNYQFGINVGDDIETGEPTYEYINFGNYIVYKSEKQEDTNSYKITCYDKMLYAMKDYEQFNTTYPITIRNYMSALCTYLGLTFKNASDTFPNYNKNINTELFLNSEGKSIGYTFRDVLDQLAEVTASTICINEDDDNLEIRYINDTSDIIDEEYFKDINVNFGESTKPINTIVLSRAGGSDKVYRSYPENLPDDQKNAIEIADNQFMNFNDRDTYLPDILNKLLGLTYSLNDFSSTGITYYDLCDRYSVKIGDNTYSCVMFNDEINVTQGLEELVHTDLPSETVTDYTKADKTDRRINETYLIVDKQNQVISSVVSDVGEQNEKISTIEQTVNEINSKISDIADITKSAEDTDAQVELTEINESEPVQLKIHPIITNISYDYPHNDYPQNDYCSIRTIRFHNTETNEDFDYELPEDLLYYDGDNYDEFLLDYGDGEQTQICRVTKKCKWNADGSVGLLATPETHNYEYPAGEHAINLTDGDYVVSILTQSNGYLFVRLMAKNIYTTQFYTKAQVDSQISQTAQNIELGVNQTLTNYVTTSEMSAAINIKANEINSQVSETYTTKTQTNTAKNEAIASAKNYTDGELEDYSTTVQMTSAINQKANEITSTVSETYETKTDANNTFATKTTTNSLSSRISQTAKSIALSVNNGSTSSGITITTTKENGSTEQVTGTIEMNGLVKFNDLSNAGSTTINGANITTGSISADRISGGTLRGQTISGGEINGAAIKGGTLEISKAYTTNLATFTDTGQNSATYIRGSEILIQGTNNPGYYEIMENDHLGIVSPNNSCNIYSTDIGLMNGTTPTILLDGTSGTVRFYNVSPYSKEELKKNIEKFNKNALDKVLSGDIYTYNYKIEDDNDKKHIGLIIGKNYKTPEEVMDKKHEGIDLYNMCSILWKAVQEQQATIEDLQNRIEKLERESEK